MKNDVEYFNSISEIQKRLTVLKVLVDRMGEVLRFSRSGVMTCDFEDFDSYLQVRKYENTSQSTKV